MVRTPSFHCRGHRFNQWFRELGSLKLYSGSKKKKKIEREGEREREEGVEKFYEQWEQPM